VLILHAVKNVLRNERSAVPEGAKTVEPKEKKTQRRRKRPNIIVEITKPDFEGPMKEQGADETVPSAEITAKLLARAVGMQKVRVIEFIRKILTSEKVSNEVYELEIGGKVRPKVLEDCKEKRGEGKCTFSDFAYEIAERYRKKYKDPITVVGVQSGGSDYINPKDKDFSKIKDTINAAIVLAWEPPKKLRKQ
jgi:hypothetical protein